MTSDDTGRPHRSPRRAARAVIFAVATVAVAAAAGWWSARPAVPDAFYNIPSTVPGEPGRPIRVEPFDNAGPAGVRGHRILYTTTRRDGSPAVASAVVLTSAEPARGPRPVIAWAHGTTGIVPGCAPSVMAKPFANIPAFDAIFTENWIYVGTDYVGLGTAGGHAYLVGEEAARAVLDSVRAVRLLPDLGADDRTVVWGHSQGGNTALWTGIVAPTYAADVPLAGVAAQAPASDLVALVAASRTTFFGKIVSAYLVAAYEAIYPEVAREKYVSRWWRPIVADIAGRCVGGWETLASVAETLLLPKAGIFARDPTEGSFGARLVENTPLRPIAAPVLIAQGVDDDLVGAAIQDGYVAERCAKGQALDHRTYPGRDHLSLVAKDSPAGADLVAWTRDRFAGRPAAAGCRR